MSTVLRYCLPRQENAKGVGAEVGLWQKTVLATGTKRAVAVAEMRRAIHKRNCHAEKSAVRILCVAALFGGYFLL